MSKRAEPWVGRACRETTGPQVYQRVLCIPLLEGETLVDSKLWEDQYGDGMRKLHVYLNTTPAQQEPEILQQWDRITILEDHVADLLTIVEGITAWRKEVDLEPEPPAQQERGEDRRDPRQVREAIIANIPGLCRRTTGERRGT